MPPLANKGASQFIPGVLLVFIMSIDVILLSLKTNKYAFIRLCISLKPSVYQQYFGFFFKAEILYYRLGTPIPRSLLKLTFTPAVFLVLSMSAKYSAVCRLSVNQLTGIQCRTREDISLPLSLLSDDTVKSKSSSDADWVYDRQAL